MNIKLTNEEYELLLCAVKVFLILPENDPEKIGLQNHKQIEDLLTKLKNSQSKQNKSERG